MNEIEKAITLLETGSKFPKILHTVSDVDNACKLAIDALQEKAGRDKMRCGNCMFRMDAETCPCCCYGDDGETVCFIEDENGFCSGFKPKEG